MIGFNVSMRSSNQRSSLELLVVVFTQAVRLMFPTANSACLFRERTCPASRRENISTTIFDRFSALGARGKVCGALVVGLAKSIGCRISVAMQAFRLRPSAFSTSGNSILGLVFAIKHRSAASWARPPVQPGVASLLHVVGDAKTKSEVLSAADSAGIHWRSRPCIELGVSTGTRKELEVFNSVVGGNMIPMMNHFRLEKKAANVPLHHKPVLTNIAMRIAVWVVGTPHKNVALPVCFLSTNLQSAVFRPFPV